MSLTQRNKKRPTQPTINIEREFKRPALGSKWWLAGFVFKMLVAVLDDDLSLKIGKTTQSAANRERGDGETILILHAMRAAASRPCAIL